VWQTCRDLASETSSPGALEHLVLLGATRSGLVAASFKVVFRELTPRGASAWRHSGLSRPGGGAA
jgi:hypothetical protein